MNILIFTQKVDLDDTVLSFFHRWIVEFAKNFNSVIVICLYEGRHELPANVRVLSLGKERGGSKLKYLKNFYSYIVRERRNYDSVFIHMNQEYAILGGFLWRMWGKKTGMWRNHHAGSFLTDVAAFFVNMVFCTSKYSFTAKYKKTKFMPVGIDTETFSRHSDIARVPRSILSLGRISPSKRLDLLASSFVDLKKSGTEFVASVYGDALPADAGYLEELKEIISEADLGDMVHFQKGIPNDRTPEVYSAHDIFVNLSSSGMYDKTIFEAMACESLVLASNENLRGLISDEYIFKDKNAEEFKSKLCKLLALPQEEKAERGKRLREAAEEVHSLQILGKKLFEAYDI